MPSPNDDTIRAFKETEYVVDDDPPIVMTIGQRNDGLRVLFASFNVECAAFITACNPRSERLALEQNMERQAELLSEIESLRLNYFVGRGEHPKKNWVEDSYLVLGITRDKALALAEQFDQSGFIWIPNTAIPELVILD